MIQIDYKDRRPLYEQVVERYKELILNGVLEPDSKLPSVRQMAMELSVTPNTIQRAYSELESEGFIYTVTGRGNFVAEHGSLQELGVTKKKEALQEAMLEAKKYGISKEEAEEILRVIYGGNNT